MKGLDAVYQAVLDYYIETGTKAKPLYACCHSVVTDKIKAPDVLAAAKALEEMGLLRSMGAHAPMYKLTPSALVDAGLLQTHKQAGTKGAL